MKVYSDIFDYIDVKAIERPSEFDSEAPTNMIFSYEEPKMEKQAFQTYGQDKSIQNFFGCYTVSDKDIWKISGKNIVRVEKEISEG